MVTEMEEEIGDKQQEAEILRRLNARRGRRSLQAQAQASARVASSIPAPDATAEPAAAGEEPSAEEPSAEHELDASDGDHDSDGSEAGGRVSGGHFTVLEEVERAGQRAVHRTLPDWLAQPCQIGDARPPLDEVAQLAPALRDRLRQLGVERLFPVQAAVLPYLLTPTPLPPSDLCVSAPTGSGKTLAFVLPLVQVVGAASVRRVRALVVLPTQALAAQVAAVFRQYAAGLSLSVRLLGGDTLARERRRLVSAGPRGPLSLADIVVSTPGRLMDHLSTTDGFSLAHLRYLVIDEADRVIEMAETGWLSAVERAAAQPGGPPRRAPGAPLTPAALCAAHLPLQKLLFSATLSQNPEKLQRLRLFQPRLFVSGGDAVPQPGQFVGKFTTPAQLRESFCVCPPQLKPLLLHHLLHRSGWTRVLVFTNSNETAHRLTLLLDAMATADRHESDDAETAAGVAEFSGSVAAAQRRRSLAALSSGHIQTLICSDAMARGMDVDAVDAVVSFDIPALAKTYVHRVGRTARAGLPGEAVTILLSRQHAHFQRLLAQAGKPQQMTETVPPLDELRQYEAAYVEALQKVLERVQRESEESASKLRARPADKRPRKSASAVVGRQKRPRKRKRTPAGAHSKESKTARTGTK